jgi:hypothetical protein
MIFFARVKTRIPKELCEPVLANKGAGKSPEPVFPAFFPASHKSDPENYPPTAGLGMCAHRAVKMHGMSGRLS